MLTSIESVIDKIAIYIQKKLSQRLVGLSVTFGFQKSSKTNVKQEFRMF